MTQEQYDKSVETGELQLSVWDKISFHSLSGFLFFISLICFGFDFLDTSDNFLWVPVWIAIIPIIFGFLLYRYENKGLKFQSTETNLSKGDLLSLLKKLCDEQKWSVTIQEDNILIARTKTGLWGGTSKRITILFNNNEVFVNSIRDPDTNKSSIDFGNRNKGIVKTIIDCIESCKIK